MLKRTLPDWNDENGVADLADAIVAREEAIADWFEAYGTEAADFFTRESKAIEAVELRNDVAPLAALLLDKNWDWLQPQTRKLMSESILGRRSKKRGRRKMAPEKRWVGNPIHRAASAADLLMHHFRRLYPEQSRKAVRARAIELAAKQIDIAASELRRQLDRSQHSHHRIT